MDCAVFELYDGSNIGEGSRVLKMVQQPRGHRQHDAFVLSIDAAQGVCAAAFEPRRIRSLSSIEFRQHQQSTAVHHLSHDGPAWISLRQSDFFHEGRKAPIRKAATDPMAAYRFSDWSLLLEDAGYAVGAVDDAGGLVSIMRNWTIIFSSIFVLSLRRSTAGMTIRAYQRGFACFPRPGRSERSGRSDRICLLLRMIERSISSSQFLHSGLSFRRVGQVAIDHGLVRGPSRIFSAASCGVRSAVGRPSSGLESRSIFSWAIARGFST